MHNHPDLEKLYPGNLFMVVAPSGAGKSSLVNALLAKDNHIHLSVSYTTRPPRPTEKNGREYQFVNLDEFKKLRDQGDFLEWAEVHGNFYATSRSWIAQKMSSGTDILMEIDWQGARQVRQHFQNAVEIFILPPSINALEERLKNRGQDALDTITRRLLAAGSEIAHVSESDYVIINQSFEQALSELESIVSAARLRVNVQRAKHTQLFTQLGIH